MPFSRLLTSTYATTTAIVRCSSSSSSGGLCSHGAGSGRSLRHSKRVSGTEGSTDAFARIHSAFSHLAARHYALFAQLTAGKGLSSLQKAPTPPRARTICSHKDFALDLERLFHGNEEYVARMAKDAPGFLAKSANEAQQPSLMILDCADSRVDEQAMFSAPLGTAFTTSNIANQFNESDLNTNAVLSFAVEALKVRHIIVLAHYGCGGVANSMMPPPSPMSTADFAVQKWIHPIRQIYETSSRPEIKAHREKAKLNPLTELPDIHEPAFRALIEENLKLNVQKVVESSVIREKFASSAKARSANDSASEDLTASDLFVHGWIYDMESGKVFDLGVSVGPPGRDLPPSPFPLVKEMQN